MKLSIGGGREAIIRITGTCPSVLSIRFSNPTSASYEGEGESVDLTNHIFQPSLIRKQANPRSKEGVMGLIFRYRYMIPYNKRALG